MKDLELYQEIQRCRRGGMDVALVTVVETRGSTPREEGARMAVLPDGRVVGTVGGGCVEGRVRSEALKTLITERATQTITVDLDSELGSVDGDICGGTMTLLLEYLPSL